MTPMLASDFGNLGVLLVVLSTLLFCLLVGITGAVFKIQPLQVLCAIISFAAGVITYRSIPTAKSGDVFGTVALAIAAMALGALLLILSLVRKRW